MNLSLTSFLEEKMEVATSETYINYASQNQLSPPSNKCLSADQGQCEALNSSQEQSLHIIVEPQIDGHTNYIHLINPPTGQIISSYIAEHGSHIEIQPGVFFRVPFPHEHGYPYGGNGYPIHNQHPYHQGYPTNMNSHNRQNVPSVIIPSQQYNPSCSVHGSPRNSQMQPVNECLDKRREKLQKKICEKQADINCCTCMKHTFHNKFNDGSCDTDLYEADISVEDISLNISEPLQAEAISPYAIIVKWGDCLKTNTLFLCDFELQVSVKENVYNSIYSGKEKSFIAQELHPGTLYTFRLRAVLNDKQGSYCNPVTCKTLCTVPDKPLPPRVTQKSKNSLTLKWAMPYDGGSPVRFYRLQWKKDLKDDTFEDIYVGIQKQFKVNHKLPPSTSCQFRLQAANDLGESNFSTMLECCTSGGPPNQPEQPELIQSQTDSLVLSWKEPENNGSSISEYKLEMNNPADGYGFMVQYCGELKKFCCINLQRNTPYTFRLLATNMYGSSKYSVPVTYSTLPEAPGKMAKPTLNGKIKPFSIPLKWGIPKDTGGEEIIGYILEMDDGLGQSFFKVYHGPDNEFVINNLQPGRTYQIKVASESKVGVGIFSPVANFTTLAVCPKNVNPPRLSSAFSPEMNVIHLEWDTPLDIGGSAITSYSIKIVHKDGDSQVVYNGPKQMCSVGGLEPGKEYNFSMQATNSAGSSQWSSIAALKTAPGPPDAVHPPTVSFKSPTHIFFDWMEPILHGAPVTMYTLEKLENELFQKVFHGATLFCDVKQNIQPASTYYFRLQAHSSAGNSPYSSVFTVKTPPAPPGPVHDIKIVEQTSNSCFLEWHHPLENGSRVYEYILEATGTASILCTIARPAVVEEKASPLEKDTPVLEKPVKGETETLDSSDDDYSTDDDNDDDDDEEEAMHSSMSDSETSVISRLNDDIMEYRLTGLVPDTLYKLRIQAVNEVGIGAFSQYVQFYTKELPPPAPSLTASSVSYHSIKLKWGHQSSSKKSMSVLNHILQMQNKSGSFNSVYCGMDTSFTLSKLKELTPYCFRIRSTNEAGEGEFSIPKVFYTKAQPPSHVKDLKCENVGTTSIKLVWTPIESIRPDDIIKYTLQMQNVELGKDFCQIYHGAELEFTVSDLEPDKTYQFRVYATRTISVADRNILSNVPEEIKGINSSIIRVHTLNQATLKQSESELVVKKETIQTPALSDTHIALIILGSFLGICVFITGITMHFATIS